MYPFVKRVLEKELKIKSDEVNDLKGKYEQEQTERQRLQKQLHDLCSTQTDSSRKLLRAQDVAEKLRTDNRKKAEQMEKMDKTISQMEDRMRNLEIRASEVEKAELTLESTRRALENSQVECRAKEKDLEREREKYDGVCKELERSRNQMEALERKLEDLKLQVRHELMKNENIEKGLETIPRLKEDIQEREDKISSLQKELEEKAVLLNASRRNAREYKEQIREIERRDVETICLRDELEVARNEVDTLKRLMVSKDTMVLQKCQALDTAKSAVSSLRVSSTNENEKRGLRQINLVLEQLRQMYANGASTWPNMGNQKPLPHNRFAQSRPWSAVSHCQDHNRDIDVNNHPYSGDNSNSNNHSNGITTTSSNNNNNNFRQQQMSPDYEQENERTGESQRTSTTYVFLERFLNETEGLNATNQKRARTAPGAVGPSLNGNSSKIERRASFHYLDQNRQDLNNGSSVNARDSHSSGAGLHSRRRATSSQNVNTSEPFSSLVSPRSRKSNAKNAGPNLYVSETTSNKLKHQPSLEYCLGLSTDDEQTTNNNFYLSGGRKSGSSFGNSTNTNGTSASKPRSSFALSNKGHSGSDSESGSHDPSSDGGKLSHQQQMALSRVSGSEKDRILSEVIHIGDRVSISVTQKPPRYGRKKPKPVTHTGIIKYKGMLDNQQYDARIFVGLRLDSPWGDSDGTFKGKRYMFTPKDHGKFFKIRDLDSVLDVTSSQYIPTSKLIMRHLDHRNSQTTASPISNGTSSASHSIDSANNSQLAIY